MSTDGKTLKFRAAKLKGFTVFNKILRYRGESLPSSDGFPSLPLSLVVPVIRADLH